MHTLPTRREASRGFTLIELMIAILVAGILLGVGLPSFRGLTAANRMTATVNALVRDTHYAQQEAMKRSVRVTFCRSVTGVSCSEAADAAFLGWIVFVDDADAGVRAAQDGNGTVDAGEEVLRAGTVPEQIEAEATGRRIVYLSDGYPDVDATDPLSRIVLCDSRGNVTGTGGFSAARGFLVTPTGRPKLAREVAQVSSLGGCP